MQRLVESDDVQASEVRPETLVGVGGATSASRGALVPMEGLAPDVAPRRVLAGNLGGPTWAVPVDGDAFAPIQPCPGRVIGLAFLPAAG